jgi:UDP-N-acetylmuramyl pentapeptide phosphotransferase/UDP-N-acetylglucosamine-1-phosphate transferase
VADHAGLVGLALAVFVASAVGTHALVPWLTALRLVDQPNDRSSHAVPTPRGGGLAPVLVLVLAGMALVINRPALGLEVLLALAGALAVMSLVDDRRGLDPRLRFLGQSAAVGLALAFAIAAWPQIGDGRTPIWLLWPGLALAWLWFTNAFNFMDGIDGLSGVELVTLGAGIAAVLIVHPAPAGAQSVLSDTLIGAGLMLGASGAGFLTANWHPARVFLGDVGSIPLGFLSGGALLGLASAGFAAAALILPAYYLVDATTTLVLRLFRGEPVTQPHRSHAYQIAVRSGLSHADVCKRVMLLNLGLVLLAVLSPMAPVLSTSLAFLAASLLCLFFRRLRPGQPSATGR